MTRVKLLVTIAIVGLLGVCLVYTETDNPGITHQNFPIDPAKSPKYNPAGSPLATTQTTHNWTYKITGPAGTTKVEVDKLGQVVYFELDATAPDYVWGNILTLYETDKLQAVSIEEAPTWPTFWVWWTDATGMPGYGGGGSYYYYDRIAALGISNLGSDWAKQWVAWYGDGVAGPVGTVDPGYGQTVDNPEGLAARLGIPVSDVARLGAIRLYTSTYAGGLYGSVPLRLGFKVISTSPTHFYTLGDTADSPIAYDWYWQHRATCYKSIVELIKKVSIDVLPEQMMSLLKENVITNGMYESFMAKVGTALEKYRQGDFATAFNLLNALYNEILAQLAGVLSAPGRARPLRRHRAITCPDQPGGCCQRYRRRSQKEDRQHKQRLSPEQSGETGAD
ncbi:MAG: hypothetical protein AB1599_10700 [Planctomycetota bacterium]